MFRKDLFSDSPACHCIVAVTTENKTVGYAMYYFGYVTHVGRSMTLEEIYVKKESRKRSYGKSLLKSIAKVNINFFTTWVNFLLQPFSKFWVLLQRLGNFKPNVFTIVLFFRSWLKMITIF